MRAPRSVARVSRRIALTPAFLLRLVIALALIAAPAAMMSTSNAIAAASDSTAAAMEHCQEAHGKKEDQAAPGSCCIVTCSALVEERMALASVKPLPTPYHISIASAEAGLIAEAETPPPRSSGPELSRY